VSAAARAARLTRAWGSVPTLALVGDVDPAPARAGGWEVRGRLAADPFSVPSSGRREDVAGYLDADELVADARVDGVLLDGADPGLAALLPLLRAAGLLVLLPGPAPLDVEALRAARAVDGPESGVGLVCRWEPWARTVAAAVPPAGPPVQVTVRGWPTGAGPAAELADLVGSWCGEVAAVAAAPAPLPADALPDGEPVDWALLTASGVTVLVSHTGAQPSVRVSFAAARLHAGPSGARWHDGAALPLLPAPAWVPPAPRGVPLGLVATAAALSEALAGAELPPARSGVRPADLGDLLVCARVVEALRTSARTERLVPTA
jgi:hypothetical protein